MTDNSNKKHWNDMNTAYSDVWKSQAKKIMHAKEMGFIRRYLWDKQPVTILDIGVGTGRILDTLIPNSPGHAKIFGIDVAERMIKATAGKFRGEKKVIQLQVCDLANQELPFQENFDFITAIRVLKYNKNWQEMLKKIHKKLNPNGIFIFTMLNVNSLNRFARYPISLHKTTKSELQKILQEAGYKILEIKTFTRIPDVFYDFSNNALYVKLLMGKEAVLSAIFGKTLFGRIFFVACCKK